jgi:hypothetical protein
MKDAPGVEALMEAGSIRAVLKEASKKNVDIEVSVETVAEAWIGFCEMRMDYDFEYFACVAETIRDKETGDSIPFILNKGQRKLLGVLLDMVTANLPVRIIFLLRSVWYQDSRSRSR